MVFPYLSRDSQGLMELYNIAKRVYSLRPNNNLLLLHFAVHPASSAYEFADPALLRSARSSSNPKDLWLQKYTASLYRDTKNQTTRLTKLKLIEEVTDQPSPRKAKYYKLTKYGVYYVIAELSLTSVIVRSLLRNYGDHPLFRYFVYPWIRQDTLLTVSGDSIFLFSQLSSYLRDCCTALKDTVDYLDWPVDLFIWEDIRTGNEDAKALCGFLTQRLGWPWLEKAYIQKNNKVLEVRGAESQSVLIRLSDDRKKATVSYKDKKEIELPVTNFSHRMIVQIPTRQLDEIYIKSFASAHRGLVQRLIFSMVSDVSIDSDTLRILVQDDNFREAFEKTKIQFEQRYNIFSKRNEA
ncbi:MAG: hypothetical protein M3P08_12425 [Thermoproteota archaeon]|nr:hypothetical protein [Thermoproteota archaeon]